MRFISQFLRVVQFVLLPFVLFFSQPAFSNERADVLKSFHGSERGELIESYDEQQFQHKVMFVMGIVLLIFIILAAGLGISMAMLGKDVFVAHMVCAGISVFLSIAHAVVGIVWFYPF